MTDRGSQAPRRLAEVRCQRRREQVRLRAFIGGLVVVAAVVAAILVVICSLAASPALRVPPPAPLWTGSAVPRASSSPTTSTGIWRSMRTAQPSRCRRALASPARSRCRTGSSWAGNVCTGCTPRDTTGVIHVESPAQRTYTLGQFSGIWGRTLSGTRVGGATGTVTAFVNGKRVTGDPRAIKLRPREVIQLDVGTVVPPHSYTFPSGL